MPAANETNIAANVVKALGIVLNTGSVYDSDHPVFRRTLKERFEVFKNAVDALGSLSLVFQGGQVSYKGAVLEPGADMFEKLARRMASKGIQGLTFKQVLAESDIRKLADLLKQMREAKAPQDLQALFESEKIRGLETFTPKKGPATRGGGESKAAYSDRRTFELDMEAGAEELALEDVLGAVDSPETEAAQAAGAIRGFVGNVLDSVIEDRISMDDAADTIAEEFENQLNSRLQDYRAKTEARIQRLENIKDLVLDELESLELAAIVVDPQHNIIAMNHSGRKLLGKVGKLESGHPIAAFLESSREKQTLTLDGETRTAHLVISESSQGNEGAMLICLE